MIDIRVDKADLDRLLGALVGFRDFRKRFLNDLPRTVLGWVKQRIRTRIITEKRGPDGEHWPDWAEGSEGVGSLLYGRRTLVNSFRVKLASGAGQLGSNSPYAAIHHYGGLAGRRNRRVFIPARPYFGIGKDDETRIEDVIQQWLDRNPPA